MLRKCAKDADFARLWNSGAWQDRSRPWSDSPLPQPRGSADILKVRDQVVTTRVAGPPVLVLAFGTAHVTSVGPTRLLMRRRESTERLHLALWRIEGRPLQERPRVARFNWRRNLPSTLNGTIGAPAISACNRRNLYTVLPSRPNCCSSICWVSGCFVAAESGSLDSTSHAAPLSARCGNTQLLTSSSPHRQVDSHASAPVNYSKMFVAISR